MNRFRHLLILLSLSFVYGVYAQRMPSSASLSPLKDALVGISVRDAGSGKEVVSKNNHILFTGASVMKLLTTATALNVLGPEYRFPTEIRYTGTIEKGGILRGDIYIVGSGDPSLGSRFFPEIPRDTLFSAVVRELKALGVQQISGRVMASVSEADLYPINPYWLHTDLGNHYAPHVSRLCLYDNAYSLTLYKDKRGVKLFPEVPGLKIEPRFEVSARKETDSLHITGPLDTYERAVYGLFPASKESVTIRGSIPRPALFAARTLSSVLQQNGIVVSLPAVETSAVPDQSTLLYRHLSPTLLEISKITNVHSHNLFAEQLLLALTPPKSQALAGQNIFQTAISHLEAYWVGRGLSLKETDLMDGSGLSPYGRLSPAFLTGLLAKEFRSPQGAVFRSTLPFVGQEGSVKNFLKGSRLEGKARLKSGSMRQVVAYAGYIPYKGKTYAVCIMINNHNSTYRATRDVVGKVLLSMFP
ncbi:MAG: D-alanyl-D-alanine carboxypeptidase/D-alanyl-D-alanine-endopeptidase [Porphyromonas sp.]|nr:D-alanyl-D-alanine carboxypeptidase/D-alanyl-D-alanine-endopeptidase [Porphyromonas sp.]